MPIKKPPLRPSVRRSACRAFISLLGLGIIACGDPSGDSAGFGGESSRERNDPFRITGIFNADHEDLTQTSLSFLSSGVLEAIETANEDTDGGSTQHKSEYHFDNCRLKEGTERLAKNYQTLLDVVDPSLFIGEWATDVFGQITHMVQDFYAHSNWAEQQHALGTHNIAGFGEFLPTPFLPGGSAGANMVVLEAVMPSGFAVSSGSGSKRPVVSKTENGVTTTMGVGLITGTFADNEDSSACVAGGSIRHGRIFDEIDFGNTLAKDDPDAPHHDKAKSLARAQTTYEFCRFSRLVSLRWGQPGLTNLHSKWGVSASEYSDKCGDSPSKVAALIVASLG